MSVVGYYSLMQYVPNPQRHEGLNCGLLLLVPAFNYFDIITNPSINRLALMCCDKNIAHIKAQIKYTQSNILSQKDRLLKEGSYVYLPFKVFNETRFTPLVLIKLQSDIDCKFMHTELFNKLVKENESLLERSVRTLLDKIQDNLFYVDKRGGIQEDDVVMFTRAVDLLVAADAVKDALDD